MSTSATDAREMSTSTDAQQAASGDGQKDEQQKL